MYSSVWVTICPVVYAYVLIVFCFVVVKSSGFFIRVVHLPYPSELHHRHLKNHMVGVIDVLWGDLSTMGLSWNHQFEMMYMYNNAIIIFKVIVDVHDLQHDSDIP